MPNQDPPNTNQNETQGNNNPSVPFSPQADLPPLPPDFQAVAEEKTEVVSAPPSENPPQDGSSAPLGPDIANLVNTPKKKFGTNKIIATVLGILMLVGGVGAGIALTSQKQLFQQKASEEVNELSITPSPSPSPSTEPTTSPSASPSNEPWILPSASPKLEPTPTVDPKETPLPVGCDESVEENCIDIHRGSIASENPDISDFTGVEDNSIYSSETFSDISENDLTKADPNRIYLRIIYNNIYCLDGRGCEDLQKKTVVGWKGSAKSDGPKNTFGNSQLIPLTNAEGKWIKDTYPVFRSSNLVKGLGVTRLGNGNVLISHASNMTNKTDYKREFQAIDATMKIVGSAIIQSFEQEDRGLAPDDPINGNSVAWHGVDTQGNGSWSLPPLFSERPCGNDEIAWEAGKTSWKHYTRICFPGDDYIMKLKKASAAPYCAAVEVYDTEWNLIPQAKAINDGILTGGTKYRFAVKGSPAENMTKAKFTFTLSDGTTVINKNNIVNKKPGTNLYYVEYIVPKTTTSLDVKAWVNDGTNWY